MKLWDELRELNFHHISIHDSKAGKETFGVGTRYDWYVLQNAPSKGSTKVKDEQGLEHKINLSLWPWLPNAEFETIQRLFAKEDEERCPIICDSSYHSARKDITSKIQNDTFVHPVLHAHVSKGTRWFWANSNERGHFGVPKVLFGDSGMHDPIIDLEGKWGMTEHAMAIEVRDVEEAHLVKQALLSKGFERVLAATKWSNFQIDWRMFADFRRDWYLEFQDE